MDLIGMFKQFVGQAQAVSKGVRTGDVAAVSKCGLPGCGTITAGARCEKCSRALCIKHTFFRVELPVTLKAYCPYCVLALNPGLFRDSDEEAPDSDTIDAEYEGDEHG